MHILKYASRKMLMSAKFVSKSCNRVILSKLVSKKTKKFVCS